MLDEAHVVPFGNRENTVLYSDRIDADRCTLWHPVYNLDLTRLCLRHHGPAIRSPFERQCVFQALAREPEEYPTCAGFGYRQL